MLQVLLAVSAVGVVVIGTLMIVNMNASERSQAGPFLWRLACWCCLA